MAKIKHVALRTADVEKTAAFYKEVFGLRQVGRGRSGIYLSDGHINLAILKYEPGKDAETGRIGIDHLGFQVEDVDGAVAKLKELGGESLMDRVDVTPKDASIPQSYYEIKCLGPDRQVIDISGSGWVGTD